MLISALVKVDSVTHINDDSFKDFVIGTLCFDFPKQFLICSILKLICINIFDFWQNRTIK